VISNIDQVRPMLYQMVCAKCSMGEAVEMVGGARASTLDGDQSSWRKYWALIVRSLLRTLGNDPMADRRLHTQHLRHIAVAQACLVEGVLQSEH
jgi:hypothetical protein